MFPATRCQEFQLAVGEIRLLDDPARSMKFRSRNQKAEFGRDAQLESRGFDRTVHQLGFEQAAYHLGGELAIEFPEYAPGLAGDFFVHGA